ncbi:MAG: sensor histidine kinase [Myxococcaceae bacterium]
MRGVRRPSLALIAMVACLTVGACAHGDGAPADTPNELSDAGPHVLNGVAVAAAIGLVSLLLTLGLLLGPNRAVRSTREVEELARRQAAVMQEEDRRRIAQELHDGAGQALTAAHFQLEAMRQKGIDTSQVDLVIRLVETAMDEIRRSTSALAPPVLAELGFREAISRHCEVFAAATGLRVSFQCAEALPPLPATVEIGCYRIAQEALQNVVRHADAGSASLRVRADERELVLEVEDDGVGPTPSENAVGLRTIRERSLAMNAKLEVSTGAKGGLRLHISVPLPGIEARS